VVLLLLAILAWQSATRSIDFPVYHRAAAQVLAGDYNLYPPEAYEGRAFPSQGFRYLPAVAVFFVPFGWLPLELAALAFFLLNLAAVYYVGVTVIRHVNPGLDSTGIVLLACLVVGGYLAENLRFGNVHFLCIALLVLAYDRVEADKVVAPAAALALAIAMKLTPLALLGYFAYRRRVALCLATVSMLVALVILPAAVIGNDENMRQLRAYRTYALGKLDEGDNYSLRGVLVRYLTPGYQDGSHAQANVAELSASTVDGLWVLGVIGMGLAGLAAVWRSSDDRVARLLEFTIVLTFILLASPHTQRRYFVTLYVPAVVLVALLAGRLPEGWRRQALIGLILMAAPSTILPALFGGRRLALLYETSSPYFFATLGLFGVLVSMTIQRKRRRGAVDEAALST
jgi:hypothetical protein